MHPTTRLLSIVAVTAVLASACAGGRTPLGDPAAADPPLTPASTQPAPTAPAAEAPIAPAAAASTAAVPGPDAAVAAETQRSARRPAWLGTRVLPAGPDGFAAAQPTPPELRDRRLPPPEDENPVVGDGFEAEILDVPADVLARSTWSAACPVGVEDLAYVRVPFWGFDDQARRGELLVHRDVASDVVEIFTALFDERFPIERMRVVAPEELQAPPTGDGNNTTAFVCRAVRDASRWSAHAYGLAIDVNPFHNPYVRDELILPELSTAYADRSWVRPGMLVAGGAAVTAFTAAGWTWGGNWKSPLDWMHFSAIGY